MSTRPHDARSIAAALREAADLLAAQGANRFRIAAYHKAADVVASHPGSLRELFEREGRAGLAALPAVGQGIAAAIAEMLVAGRWAQLEHLRGSHDPSRRSEPSPASGRP